MLNDLCSSWSSVLAGVPQGSILEPLLFLIYINDLPENLQSTVKLFADGTICSTVYDPNISASQLESDLNEISHWACKWKMVLNPYLSKQSQEDIFSRKTVKVIHPSITFNTLSVAHTTSQKHLGLYLDEKLSFYDHINAKVLKANKGIEIIKRLSNILHRNSLLTICKSFIRPYLDYCDIIYHQPNSESFCIEKLGLEALEFRRWFRRLCTFSKIKTNGKPEHLLNLIPTGQHSYNTRSLDQVETYYW